MMMEAPSSSTMKALLTIAAILGLALTATAVQPPNVVLIVADDLGYGDLGCYGNAAVKTPNLDRMAAEGMRFTDFYANSPMCSPTRAALLTGRYQQRVGVTKVGDVLNRGEIVIAQRLREQAGYATGYFGKWHVSGHYHDEPMRRERMPMDYGFDQFRGLMGGFIDFQNYLHDRGELDWWHQRELVTDDRGYATHILTDHAVNFIREHSGERPFFVVLAMPDIHFPWMTPDDPPYYQPGERMVNFDPERNRLGPHAGTDRLQAAVHRMIEETDRAAGRILDTLNQLAVAKDTLVFFVSDNGGILSYQGRYEGQISNNGPLRGEKITLYEGGIRVPAIAWRPGTVPAGVVTRERGMTFDLFPTLLELAGLETPPADCPHALDGISLVPLLHRGHPLPNRVLFWGFGNQRAVRQGKWKFLQRGSASPALFDLQADPGESRNLADDHPERLAEMATAWADRERDTSSAAPNKETPENRDERGR
jgi:arylsulfatase A